MIFDKYESNDRSFNRPVTYLKGQWAWARYLGRYAVAVYYVCRGILFSTVQGKRDMNLHSISPDDKVCFDYLSTVQFHGPCMRIAVCHSSGNTNVDRGP